MNKCPCNSSIAFVFVVDLGGSARVTGQHYFLCAVAQFDGDPPHLGEVAVNFLWKGVRGVTAGAIFAT
jgi:hypothetical protein